jgi:hypothetical protein
MGNWEKIFAETSQVNILILDKLIETSKSEENMRKI